MSMKRVLGVAVAAAISGLPGLVRADDPPNDAFIAGYATAVIEHEFSVKSSGLSVADGHVTFPAGALSPDERGQLIKALTAIQGVRDVTLTDGRPTVGAAARPIEGVRVEGGHAITLTTASTASTAPAAPQAADATAVTTDDQPLRLFLGAGRTFAPLHADPRWPHLYASYNHYDLDTGGTTHFKDVANVGFGETVSLFRSDLPDGLRQEVGVQGGLFAIFDTDSDSKDLINADYFVGPYYALRYENFSLLARVYHQSSHLGDEYLLRSSHEQRVNFSFETVNLILSYDLPYGFRVYGGGGYAFDTDPGDYERWNAEYGVEWTDPDPLPGTTWVRPVAALDLQNREATDWHLSTSLRAGLQFDDPVRYVQKLQIMLEYYDGNNYNGQFYEEHIRFYGIGAHFYF